MTVEKKNLEEGDTEGEKQQKPIEKQIEACWNELTLFRRNSNRAVAFHQRVKELWFGDAQKQQLVKEIDGLLERQGNAWFYSCEEEEFASRQSKASLLGELSKMEHRRWCYYMISCGWTKTKSFSDKKDDTQKKNPCVSTWQDLMTNNPDMCKYDLMPLLILEDKKIEQDGK